MKRTKYFLLDIWFLRFCGFICLRKQAEEPLLQINILTKSYNQDNNAFWWEIIEINAFQYRFNFCILFIPKKCR